MMSAYTDTSFTNTLAKITEAIDLGNGEWLLGFTSVDRDTLELNTFTEYYKLNEIRLLYFGDEKRIKDIKEDEQSDI